MTRTVNCSAITLLLLAAASSGCDVGVSGGDDDDTSGGDTSGGDATTDGAGDDTPVVSPGIYKRGSLVPNFQIPDVSDQRRFTIPAVDSANAQAIAMTDADNTCGVNAFTSMFTKMGLVEQAIALDRDDGETVDIIPDANEAVMRTVPFRARPTDVDCIHLGNGGARVCIAPMGGDISTPGNTVAIVDENGDVEEVNVGIKPVRTVCADEFDACIVANLYSNYLSVIDMVRKRPLEKAGEPLVIPVDYYTSDVILAETRPGGAFDNDLYLYTTNEWLGTVNRYDIRMVQAGIDGGLQDILRLKTPSGPESTPDLTVTGCANNPQRMTLDEQGKALYVTENRGGEVCRVNAASGAIEGYTGVGAPSVAALEVENTVIVASTSADRGFPEQNTVIPVEQDAEPQVVTGLDGSSQIAHQGGLRDRTDAIQFEDVRNTMITLAPNLNQTDPFQMTTFTDVNSVEPFYANAAQRILTATLPGEMATDGAGRVFVLGEGNDIIQQLQVVGGAAFPLQNLVGQEFESTIRPTGVFFDAVDNVLVTTSWGSGLLEVFDATAPGGGPIDQVDLGYNGGVFAPAANNAGYPCSNIEIGEFAYNNTKWSNNGQKSCTSCHRDQTITDSFGWFNGANGPTQMHKIVPTWNQIKTENYFWNGSMDHDDYSTLAFNFQTQSNCFLVLFGVAEGVDKPADQRIGDPNNVITNGAAADQACQPVQPINDATGVPENFEEDIAPVLADELNRVDDVIAQTVVLDTGHNVTIQGRPFDRFELSRQIDYWDVAIDRVPANPYTYLFEADQLGSDVSGKITQGEALFNQAGCQRCHDPNNTRAPYQDGKLHGAGAEWTGRILQRFDGSDQIDFNAAQATRNAVATMGSQIGSADDEVNYHIATGIDSFMPFSFDQNEALKFEDPLNQQS
ncbi:MAG TPA: cytochrome c peroxidase, partial [Kofleriaceae bacterium]|nr:cytochrome c peroxidase [Kofleriaceae bacterium]